MTERLDVLLVAMDPGVHAVLKMRQIYLIHCIVCGLCFSVSFFIERNPLSSCHQGHGSVSLISHYTPINNNTYEEFK